MSNENSQQVLLPNENHQADSQGLLRPQTSNLPQNQGPFLQGQAPPPAAYGGRQPVISGVNPLAIASLACSFLGIVTALLGIAFLALLLPIVGIILGHVALNDIRKTDKGGKPEAIAGTIIGYIAAIPVVFVITILKGTVDILG